MTEIKKLSQPENLEKFVKAGSNVYKIRVELANELARIILLSESGFKSKLYIELENDKKIAHVQLVENIIDFTLDKNEFYLIFEELFDFLRKQGIKYIYYYPRVMDNEKFLLNLGFYKATNIEYDLTKKSFVPKLPLDVCVYTLN